MSKDRGRKPLSPKELAALREEKEKAKELSPAERQRKLVINFGVGILLLAFGTSTGITCINFNSPSVRRAAQEAKNKEKKISPADAEIERWQKELETHPNDPSTLTNLAFFYVERADHKHDDSEAKKDYAEASKQLDAALKVDPEYAFALRMMAKVRMREQKLEEAKKLVDSAIKAATKPIDAKDPEKEAKENNAKAEQVQDRMLLVDMAYQKKDYKTALSELDLVIKLEPGSMEAYLIRAGTLMEDKQPEAARKDLDTVLKIAQAIGGPMAGRVTAQANAMLAKIDADASPKPSGTPKASGTPTTAASGAPTTSASGTPTPVAPAPTSTPAGMVGLPDVTDHSHDALTPSPVAVPPVTATPPVATPTP